MYNINNDSALHPLQEEVFAMLRQQQLQLEQNVAEIFAAHAKSIEQLESASLKQHFPSSPSYEGIRSETVESRPSSPRSAQNDEQHNQDVHVPSQTEQIQEIETDLPHQIMDSQSRAHTSIRTQSTSDPWTEAMTIDDAPELETGAPLYDRVGSYDRFTDKVARSTSTLSAPRLQKKRTGISGVEVDAPSQVPIPRPIHPVFTRIVKMGAFEMYSVTAVIVNAITIALQADWAVNHIGEDLPSIFDIFEVMFTFVFLIELLIRFFASGRFFLSCSNRELNWNIFDTVLVSSSILELPLIFLVGSAVNFTSARLLRLMRLVRLVRLVRLLRVFRQLRVVVQTVAASLKPLLWAMILLFVVIFLSSIVILQLIDGEQQELESDVAELYGSLMRAQYTLFLIITNGVSWQTVADPLIKISELFRFFFMMFISFSFFCMVNIVTGIFVENTASQSQQDDEMVVFEEAASREQWLKQVKELFERVDYSGDGEITADEFEEAVQDMKLQVMLKQIGIDIFQINPRGLFRCLDFDNNDSITINEFSEGLMRLHGQARSLDLADVRHFVMLCLSNAERVRDIVEGHFGEPETKGRKTKKLRPLPPRSSFFKQPPAPEVKPPKLDIGKD